MQRLPRAGQSSRFPDPPLDPAVNLDLSSNNPFRHRASTPSTTPTNFSPSNPFFQPPPPTVVDGSRPVSTNPFVDDGDAVADVHRHRTAGLPSPPVDPTSPRLDRTTTDLMKLSIHGNASPSSSSSSSSSSMPVVGDASHPDSTGTRPAERARPQTSGRGDRQPSTVHHRWTRSHEEDRRPSRDGARPAPPRTLRPSRGSIGVDGALDGGRRHLPRTHRRNSDSSVVESKANPSEPRQRRHLDRPPVEVSAHGPAPSRSQPKRANRRLDVIDKLDVTSIYGTGLFHHDGPFDACNPHRNRKGSRRAPMQAFAKDSANNVLGGSGPVHRDIDHVQYFGNRGAEAFSDYSTSAVDVPVDDLDGRQPSGPAADRLRPFDPVARVGVHGDESLGLGTSTFLEGAPAALTAMHRRESEGEATTLRGAGEGMTRKKSLAKKIRSLNPARPRSHSHGRHGSLEMKPLDPWASSPPPPPPPPPPQGPLLTPPPRRPPRPSRTLVDVVTTTERDPFSSDLDSVQVTSTRTRGPSVTTVEDSRRPGPVRALDGPRRVLERSVTHDSTVPREVTPEPKATTGFLSRVRSLRGGRRPRTSERLA